VSGGSSTLSLTTSSSTPAGSSNILRTIGEALGLKNVSGLGGAASRVPMADFSWLQP